MAANALARSSVEPLDSLRNWSRFWLRRYFRIAPAYYLSLALAVILETHFLGGYQALQSLNPEKWVPNGSYDPRNVSYSTTNILVHLSFLFGLHPAYTFSTFLPDWSLSLEMQFYAVFPALFMLMRRNGFTRVGVGAGLLTITFATLFTNVLHFDEPSLLAFKLHLFIAGILLLRAVHIPAAPGKRLLTIVSALLLVSLESGYGAQAAILPVLLLSMAGLAVMESRNRVPAWLLPVLDCRSIRLASDVSYSVYLFHGFFISAAGLMLAGSDSLLALSVPQRVLAMIVFVSIATYLSAVVTHRFIELPGIRFGRDLVRRFLPAAGPGSRQGGGAGAHAAP